MPNKEIELQPWQIFAAMKDYFGVKCIAMFFGNKEAKYFRTEYNYAQDPLTTQKRGTCPLERVWNMLRYLDRHGMGYLSRATLRYLDTAINKTDPGTLQGILPSMPEEKLSDYAATARLHEAVEKMEDLETFESLLQEAKDDLDRTVALYKKDCQV